jgi:glycosyltransferase involved in cell wall biosynthesis
MNILFVHEVSWFNKVVYEMHDFPELLSLRGHDVRFVDFDEGKSRARWRPITTVESRAHVGSAVQVTTGPRILPAIFGRLLALAAQPFLVLILVMQKRPDIVVTYSIPTSGWQLTAMCKMLRIPVVARVIDVSHVLRKTRFTKFIKWAEHFVYRYADFVSTHNEVLLKYCQALGARPTESSVILPGVDLVRFSPRTPSQNLLNQLGITDQDKVILFMGTLFRFSGLHELITRLTPEFRCDPNLKFLILGDGEDMDRLRCLTQVAELDKQIILTGRIEYHLLSDYLQLGTVAVLPFQQELVTHAALPAKVLQYLACGLPTVSTRLDGLQSIVGPDDGVVFTSSLDEMATQTLRLLYDQGRLSHLATRARAFVTQNCNWSAQIREFEQLLASLQ